MNFILTIMTFYLASGWVIYSLVGYIGSVGFCYLYDRSRVVWHVQRFRYPTNSTDDLAQELLAIPCACLCAAWLFVLRHIHYPGLPVMGLVALLIGGFFAHLVIHHILQTVVVNLAKLVEVEHSVKLPYDEVCHKDHADWFSCNAVHCLRTKYVHKLENHLNLVAPGETTIPKKHRKEDEEVEKPQISSSPASVEAVQTGAQEKPEEVKSDGGAASENS